MISPAAEPRTGDGAQSLLLLPAEIRYDFLRREASWWPPGSATLMCNISNSIKAWGTEGPSTYSKQLTLSRSLKTTSRSRTQVGNKYANLNEKVGKGENWTKKTGRIVTCSKVTYVSEKQCSGLPQDHRTLNISPWGQSRTPLRLLPVLTLTCFGESTRNELKKKRHTIQLDNTDFVN